MTKKSLSVLNRAVGGKRRLLELLGKLEKRATDEQVRQRIAKAAAYVERLYKEDAEPLY